MARTRHNHHIPNSEFEELPEGQREVKCGGTHSCSICQAEAAAYVPPVVAHEHVEEPVELRDILGPVDVLRKSGVNRTFPDSEIEHRFGVQEKLEHTDFIYHSCSQQFVDLVKWLDEVVPGGRAKSLMYTALEEAQMWANKGISEQTIY